MSDAPRSPSEPRPNDEPYYIDSHCSCGERLILYDDFHGNEVVWHDEWVCPVCQNGVYMDWPERMMDELQRRRNNFK